MLGAVGALYLVGASFLAGIVTERVRSDRERVAIVRAQAARQRQVRERAMQIELEQDARRAATLRP
jgi:hypothetical protein